MDTEPGRVLVVIPARLASERLPGKVLLRATGKYLVQHVWERAREVPSVDAVVVATDDQQVADAVASFGGEAVLTSPDCASGTDRVAEVARGRDEDIVVNLQGDEPEIDPAAVEKLVAAMREDPSLPMGTLAAPAEEDELDRPSAVKVVRGLDGRALYFSRSRIPFARGPGGAAGGEVPAVALRHVGIYAFRRDALLAFAALDPTPLERTERLEQLRALENGWQVGVVLVDRAPRGIDTPDDYDDFCRRIGAAGDEA